MDDRQLLGVLAPEHGDVGLDRGEQLRHDGRDATEVSGSVGSLERTGEVARLDGGVEALRVHRSRCGRIDRIDPGSRAAGEIGLEGARVPCEILGTVELQRVDEDGHDHRVAALASHPDQFDVAVVERTHGRHERHRRAAGAPLASPGASGVGVAEHLRCRVAHRTVTPSQIRRSSASGSSAVRASTSTMRVGRRSVS